MTVYKLPIKGGRANVTLPTGTFGFNLKFCDAPDGGTWLLDISDAQGAPLACGLPLVTGADLLGQYAYLGLGGKLYVATSGGDPSTIPTYDDLGSTKILCFEPT